MLSLAVMAALAGVLSAAQAGTSGELASRIVDRTLLCKMTGVGHPDPVRILELSSATQDPATGSAAQIYVSNGPEGSGTFANVSTGFKDAPFKSIVSWSRTTCSASKLRVPLSRKSLVGGPVQFLKQYDCDVSARVLIRVRGIFERPTRVAPNLTAKGELVYGYLAVATAPGRKPVLVASLDGSTQRAQVFVSPSRCNED